MENCLWLIPRKKFNRLGVFFLLELAESQNEFCESKVPLIKIHTFVVNTLVMNDPQILAMLIYKNISST